MGVATRQIEAGSLRRPGGSTTYGPGEPWTAAITVRVGRELAMMRETLGEHADHEALSALGRWTLSRLRHIGELLSAGAIDPIGARVSMSPDAARDLPAGRPLRLGVFPTAGNPLHWAHLLAGLAAMARFHLDKIVYVIAGSDSRKPALADAQTRHWIAREVLDLFHPLFAYSPIALGGAAPGEELLFRLMSFQGSRPLHVFYMAGSDHFHRYAPLTQSPDTIERLEWGVHSGAHGFHPGVHKLTAVFIDRGGRRDPVQSFLDIRWIRHLPLQTSSTRIRGALGGCEPLHELTGLPFSAYCAIRVQGVYGTGRAVAPTGQEPRQSPWAPVTGIEGPRLWNRNAGARYSRRAPEVTHVL